MSIIGKKLPEFTLDAFKKPELVKVSTADVLGKWSVFVFYPADFTFVCPTELEDVQESYAELKELGCEVYSVSTDSEYVHKAWSDASPSINKIEYYMLADKKHELADFFDVFDLWHTAVHSWLTQKVLSAQRKFTIWVLAVLQKNLFVKYKLLNL